MPLLNPAAARRKAKGTQLPIDPVTSPTNAPNPHADANIMSTTITFLD